MFSMGIDAPDTVKWREALSEYVFLEATGLYQTILPFYII